MKVAEFERQIEHLIRYLHPFALNLTRNEDDAMDLIQETMLKAVKYRNKFQDGTNLKAWLYTIMRNTFITLYHRTTRRNTFIDTTDNLHFIHSADYISENSATEEFVVNDIYRAINQLKAEYREPFMMMCSGFKYHEIAKKVNIPIGTVKNRIHVARQKLKKCLAVYEFVG